jgi:hypothetical protein
MKQHDLTGLQGEVSTFGSYFLFFVLAIGAGTALYWGIYGLAAGIFILALTGYYLLFARKKRFRRIFFDEHNIYVGSEKIPLPAVTAISDFGIIKYSENTVSKTLLFANYNLQNPNLKLLKEFHKIARGADSDQH